MDEEVVLLLMLKLLRKARNVKNCVACYSQSEIISRKNVMSKIKVESFQNFY